jgi:toxin FitB
MYLLDTVIVSELRKTRPSSHVVAWLASVEKHRLCLSVVTIGEIERGVEKRRAAEPEFANALTGWLETLLSVYGENVLAVTPNIARRWGVLSAKLDHEGADLLIAATAFEHNLTVATRNVKHFKPTGVSIINPFLFQ